MSKKDTSIILVIGPGHYFEEKEINTIRKSLLKWYAANHRILPWRSIAKSETDYNKKAYAVWVSEIMCQQTQVATVIDYYNKWMSKWPAVDLLAKATLEEINEIWAGLGYYSRARRLHEGALKITKEFKGEFPRGRNLIQKELPGVGRYTASAIGSIASKEPVGVVDGNVLRVMARLRAIGSDISSQTVVDEIWKMADKLVDEDEPGDFNQAIMELGATVCTPKSPSCSSCPLKNNCLAYSLEANSCSLKKLITSNKNNNTGLIMDLECVPNCNLCLKRNEWNESLGVQNFPRKLKKTSVKNKVSAVVVVRKVVQNKTNYLLIQRPKTGLLANLWEFVTVPLCEGNKNTDESEVNLRSEKALLGKLKISLQDQFNLTTQSINDINFVSDVTHIFSHIRQVYKVYETSLESDKRISYPEGYQSSRWMTEEEFMSCATSTAMKKVFKAFKSSFTAKTVQVIEKRKRNMKTEDLSNKQRKLSDYFNRVESKK